MLVMVGGLYLYWVILGQMHSLGVKILCGCVSSADVSVSCTVCAYVFIQGSISTLLVHCGPHLAL